MPQCWKRRGDLTLRMLGFTKYTVTQAYARGGLAPKIFEPTLTLELPCLIACT